MQPGLSAPVVVNQINQAIYRSFWLVVLYFELWGFLWFIFTCFIYCLNLRSLDAGASEISVIVKNGGLGMIQIHDNGCGIKASEG